MLDFYPNGRLDFCGWHVPTLYFPDYIKNDKVDWNEIINQKNFRFIGQICWLVIILAVCHVVQ